MLTTPTSHRPLVLAAVITGMAMIAIEVTIVSTAMPQIASQLGDLHLYSWVFSSFLLTQTATTVVFGKLADLYGRKPVMLIGIAIFLVGSVLCGLAWSMPSLILFRLVQGVGAGAIQPIGMTIVGDLYSVHERGKIQGYLASVWGASSVLGPFVGGLIIEHVSWAWIFWINVPIGLAAAAGFVVFLREGVVHEKRTLDIAGAALFAVAVASLMVALTEFGTSGSGIALAALGLCVVSGILFVLQERRARDPMLTLSLWTHRPIATANMATLLSSMAIIGLTTFLPMYVQGVMGRTPLVAGLTLTVMVLGWPIGATLAARNFTRFGLRRTLLFGAALMPLGALVFITLGPSASPRLAGMGSIIMGLGMGFLSNSAIVIVQGSVGWKERGSATASNIFARNLGSTLGATSLGAIVNLALTRGGNGILPVDVDQIRRLLDQSGAAIADLAAQAALAHALHFAFLGVLLIAVLTLVASTLVPRITHAPAAAADAVGG